MSEISEQISDLENEINRQKLRSIEALKKNSSFDEVNKITLRIKELEIKLLKCVESK